MEVIVGNIFLSPLEVGPGMPKQAKAPVRGLTSIPLLHHPRLLPWRLCFPREPILSPCLPLNTPPHWLPRPLRCIPFPGCLPSLSKRPFPSTCHMPGPTSQCCTSNNFIFFSSHSQMIKWESWLMVLSKFPRPRGNKEKLKNMTQVHPKG